jgi:hypothetical protein
MRVYSRRRYNKYTQRPKRCVVLKSESQTRRKDASRGCARRSNHVHVKNVGFWATTSLQSRTRMQGLLVYCCDSNVLPRLQPYGRNVATEEKGKWGVRHDVAPADETILGNIAALVAHELMEMEIFGIFYVKSAELYRLLYPSSQC